MTDVGIFFPGSGEIRIPFFPKQHGHQEVQSLQALSFRMFQGLGFRVGKIRLRVEGLSSSSRALRRVRKHYLGLLLRNLN